MWIAGFDEPAKKQLMDLAEVLNKFKSEAVQLKVLDYVLGKTVGAALGAADAADAKALGSGLGPQLGSSSLRSSALGPRVWPGS